MKIVHVIGYFVPELGYQEYYLAKKHAQMGHEVYVITSDMLYPFPNIEGMLKEAGAKETSRKRTPGFSTIDDIKVYRLRHFFEYSDFILLKGIGRILEKIKPDVVFAHESRQSPPAFAAYYKKKFGYKLIVDQHDFYHEIPNHVWWKKLLRFLDYFIFRRFIINYSLAKADRIIAVTDESRNFLVKTHHVPQSRITVVPLGVDTGAFRFSNKARTSIRKKLNIKKGDVVLVFSGTIVRRKGIEILFSALSEIRNKNAKLLIVGSGDSHYMSELKNMAGKLKIINRVIFAGFVNKNKVMDYFSASDIGVWPGNNSVSIIEAMACGLPIVMADMQLSHLVDYGNGVKFPQYNVKKLREALEKLINDKKSRSEMSAKSLRAVTENYSYDLIAKKFLELAR